MVSNQIFSVIKFAVIASAKVFLSPLFFINNNIIVRNWEISNFFNIRNPFLSNCLLPHLNISSPHVTNGNNVLQHWSSGMGLISPTFYERICGNILAPKKSLTFTSSAKISLAWNFHTKKPRVKCWWNWPLKCKCRSSSRKTFIRKSRA